MKHLILLLFICVAHTQAYSQVVYRDDGELTDSAELRMLFNESIKVLDSTNTTGLKIERLDILEVGNDKYLLPNGAMSVYKWRNNTWHNICKGANRGFNYGNKAFVHKGKIYSFGGYGFWRAHSMLIVFQEDLGEWELLPFTENLETLFGWLSPEGIIAFNNKKSIEININSQYIKERPDGFKLDYAQTFILHWYTIDFENYYVIYGDKLTLIDKITGQHYESMQTPFRAYQSNGKGMFRIFGDSVTYFKNDMDHRYDLSAKDQIQFFEIVKKTRGDSYPLIMLLSLIPVTIGAYLIYRKRTKNRSEAAILSDETMPWNNKYLEALIFEKGKILSVDELDTILEIIDIIPAESQRFKRSTLIKEINRLYSGRHDVDLIFRKHDVEDGRKYVYQIGNE
ncbi:MAG: hypothetical protein IPL13_12390 [Saprospiraceae bacterium]|nr:hypothetical protein [Candidatus Brachybacter algidus]